MAIFGGFPLSYASYTSSFVFIARKIFTMCFSFSFDDALAMAPKSLENTSLVSLSAFSAIFFVVASFLFLSFDAQNTSKNHGANRIACESLAFVMRFAKCKMNVGICRLIFNLSSSDTPSPASPSPSCFFRFSPRFCLYPFSSFVFSNASG